MLGSLLKKFDKYRQTCSITDIQQKCVTFIRDPQYIYCLKKTNKDIWVIAHEKFREEITSCQSNFCPTVNVHYTEWPEYEFTLYHNSLYKNKSQSHPKIGSNCNIHPTAIIGVEGLKLVHTPDGEKIQFVHTGHVMIGDNVDIGPYTVIHRGTMGITNIKRGCKIGAKNNIGHNCDIGEGNVFAVGVILNGGVTTGKNCWFSSGSIVKHYTNIVSNSVIGMGAVVTKDVTEAGIYIGSPAKYLKPVEEGWNF
jgi:acetyltransferase-like isoleucine patch superfamily enzyme